MNGNFCVALYLDRAVQFSAEAVERDLNAKLASFLAALNVVCIGWR